MPSPEEYVAELQRLAKIGRAVAALTTGTRFADLHAQELRLYLALAVLEASSPIRQKVFALAQLVGRSERGTQRALHRLEIAGLITRNRTCRPHLVSLVA